LVVIIKRKHHLLFCFVWLRRKLQHPHHGDFAGCTSPTGLLDSRDPFDLQQPQIGE